MKTVWLISLCLLFALPLCAQPKSYTFEQAEESCRIAPRPFAVFIKTDWCKYCMMMEKATFLDPDVTKALDRNFYFITLDAGGKDKIEFNGRTFRFIPSGIGNGTHELATALGTINGQISYPAFVILTPDYTIRLQSGSYLNSSDLLKIISSIPLH